MDKIWNSTGAAQSVTAFLDCVELFQLSHCCKGWRSVMSPSATIWKLAAERDWKALITPPSPPTMRAFVSLIHSYQCPCCQSRTPTSIRDVLLGPHRTSVCQECWFTYQRSRFPLKPKKQALVFVAILIDGSPWDVPTANFKQNHGYIYKYDDPAFSFLATDTINCILRSRDLALIDVLEAYASRLRL